MRKLIIFGLFIIGLGVALFGFQGLAANGEFNTILLNFREDIPQEVLQQDLQALAEQYHVTPQLDNKFSAKENVYIIKGDKQRLQQLRKSQLAKAVEFIEPNYIYKIPQPGKADCTEDLSVLQAPTEKAVSGPNDPMYSKQWNLHNISIEGAWSQNKGNGVTVAVIDTGVTRVPDLDATKFVPGYDFVSDRAEADDDNGHGTHVAGTIAKPPIITMELQELPTKQN